MNRAERAAKAADAIVQSLCRDFDDATLRQMLAFGQTATADMLECQAMNAALERELGRREEARSQA